MEYRMKHILKAGILFALLFSCISRAELNTGDVTIHKALTVKDCFEIAKSVRGTFFEDSFGEATLENNYYYNVDEIQISVLCLEQEKLIVVFVATLDGWAFKYLKAFEDAFNNKNNKALQNIQVKKTPEIMN